MKLPLKGERIHLYVPLPSKSGASRMVLTPRPFYYIRHGQTDWNARKLCVGQTDISLNEIGVAQAKIAAPIVQALELSAIFYSPLERARKTASLIGEGTTWPLLPEIGLKEVCLGVKEGRSESDPSDDFVSAWLADSQIEGAETFTSFRCRIVAAVNNCLSMAATAPPLIVAHSGVFMALASACDLDIDEIEHCRPYRFSPTNAGWSVRRQTG